MFLRKHRRKKDGKIHIYWSLVETLRTSKGPRHKVIGYLGDLDPAQQQGYREFVDDLKGSQSTHQRKLFKPQDLSQPVTIKPQGVRVKRVRDFGDAWVGVGFWKLLQFDRFFSNRIDSGKEDVSWEAMICFLTVSRFCRSMSKLALCERYVDQSALADILCIDALKVNKDRLYRTMDVLLPLKQALGEHLKKRYGELFNLDYELFLYDLTSTYFEGQGSRNPQAKRGYSRDKRSDCKQVTLALIVTKEGFPLSYEVFDGNRRDVTTVEEIVESVEATYGRSQRLWVMDRGMVSEDNLFWLRKRGTGYLVGTPKSMLKKFEKELLELNWESVYPDVHVKKVHSSEYQKETFVLCQSAARREKERAMLDRFKKRIEEGLEKLHLAASREKRPLRNRDLLQRKIGALLKSNSRAARFFEINVESTPEGKKKRLYLTWERKKMPLHWAELSCGCYLLRTNLSQKDMSATDIWQAYIGLTQVEEAFRVHKQDLGLRPVWHHTKERVQAHIFICFLSFVLQKTLEQALMAKGLGRSTRKVLEELKGLKSMDVILPTTQGDELNLRVISDPEPALKILLDQLKLRPPKRLSAHRNVVEKCQLHS